MLEGIHVLNTIICNDSFGIGFGICIGIFIGMAVFIALGILLLLFEYFFDDILHIKIVNEKIENTIFVLMVIILTCLITVYIYDTHQYEDYIKYQVTIDDSISFNEFSNKYNILSCDGKIYTIVEKDSDRIKKD